MYTAICEITYQYDSDTLTEFYAISNIQNFSEAAAKAEMNFIKNDVISIKITLLPTDTQATKLIKNYE